MQFILIALGALTAATAVALPQDELAQQRPGNILHPAPDGMTVEQARQRCGHKARLSCCNDATYTGDDTKVNSGVVSDVLGAGAGSQGVGLFSGCSKLDLGCGSLLFFSILCASIRLLEWLLML